MTEWKDIAGNEIRVGSYIVYAALWSRSATLKYGKVTRLTTRKPAWTPFNEKESSIPTVRVVSVDRSSHWEDGDYKGVIWHVQKDGKEVTLGELQRMLVIEPTQVPHEALQILDGEK